MGLILFLILIHVLVNIFYNLPYRTVNIKDTEYRSKKVIIHVKKQRYICPCCKKVVTYKLDSIDFNHSISKNVKVEVLNKIKDVKPKIIVIDLFMQFRNVIVNSIGDVEIVADKYHFVRQVEWMMDGLHFSRHKR